MCHRSAATALHQATVHAEQEARAAARQAEEERRAWELQQAEKDRELERWKEAQRLKLELRERSQLPAAGVRALSDPASGTRASNDREHLREQVVRTLREQPGANKTQLARSLGIGRTLLYGLIDEARKRGELP
jgi:DNA-binding NtrC family response regulator